MQKINLRMFQHSEHLSLRQCEQRRRQPGRQDHGPPPVPRLRLLQRRHRLGNREAAVNAHAHQDHGREVECERPEEHQDLAEDVAGVPLDAEPPADLQRHDHEADDQVCDGQVDDHDVDVVSAVVLDADVLLVGGDEDDDVADGADDEHDGVGQNIE